MHLMLLSDAIQSVVSHLKFLEFCQIFRLYLASSENYFKPS